MPILPAEPALYPGDLLSEVEPETTSERQWYVMHTRPQQEKSLARQLRREGVPHYLPMFACQRRFSRRVITSYLPLFPGYVPVFAHDGERTVCLATRRVVQALSVPDARQFVDDLKRIETLLASDVPVTPEERLGPGDPVRIRSGPLAGLEGTILRTDRGRRFVVTVNFMKRGASVVIDNFDLTPL